MSHIIKRRLPVFSTFIKTLLDDATATAALATLGIETGTFNPTMAFATAGNSSWAYGVQEGKYLVVGTFVCFKLSMSATPTIGTGSGVVRVSNLPFTADATIGDVAISEVNANWTWPASRTQLAGRVINATAYFDIAGLGSAVGATILTAANMTDGAAHTLRAFGMYGK